MWNKSSGNCEKRFKSEYNSKLEYDFVKNISENSIFFHFNRIMELKISIVSAIRYNAVQKDMLHDKIILAERNTGDEIYLISSFVNSVSIHICWA